METLAGKQRKRWCAGVAVNGGQADFKSSAGTRFPNREIATHLTQQYTLSQRSFNKLNSKAKANIAALVVRLRCIHLECVLVPLMVTLLLTSLYAQLNITPNYKINLMHEYCLPLAVCLCIAPLKQEESKGLWSSF